MKKVFGLFVIVSAFALLVAGGCNKGEDANATPAAGATAGGADKAGGAAAPAAADKAGGADKTGG